jgi:hypothetical protein
MYGSDTGVIEKAFVEDNITLQLNIYQTKKLTTDLFCNIKTSFASLILLPATFLNLSL